MNSQLTVLKQRMFRLNKEKQRFLLGKFKDCAKKEARKKLMTPEAILFGDQEANLSIAKLIFSLGCLLDQNFSAMQTRHCLQKNLVHTSVGQCLNFPTFFRFDNSTKYDCAIQEYLRLSKSQKERFHQLFGAKNQNSLAFYGKKMQNNQH